MGINIERLLRLVADYHQFCNAKQAGKSVAPKYGEMTLEELDFIAAAGASSSAARTDPEGKAFPWEH